MPSIDLQTKINNMLEEIPERRADDQRHTISKHDARWLANLMLIITDSGNCNRGLTEEQALAMKKLTPETIASLHSMVKERRRLLALVGTGIVTMLAFVGQKVVDVIDFSFLKSLAAKFFHVGG
jgi:hypothetical protein